MAISQKLRGVGVSRLYIKTGTGYEQKNLEIETAEKSEVNQRIRTGLVLREVKCFDGIVEARFLNN